MTADLMCGGDFESFLTDTIVPLVGYASIVTSILIAVSYMIGNFLSNPKLLLWSKTEAVQLLISVFSVFVMITAINTFCAIDMSDIASIFGLPSVPSMNIYEAAQQYLDDTVYYCHEALGVVRYHLQAYMVIAYFNGFLCSNQIDALNMGLGCLFGSDGFNQQPLGGHGAHMAVMNFALNACLMSFFSALNFLFILLFVYKGFVFLFLPLGIFLRSMPYMRPFGGLLVAVALCFLLVYPFIMAVYYLMSDVLLEIPGEVAPYTYDEITFPGNEDSSSQTAVSSGGEDYMLTCYFHDGGCSLSASFTSDKDEMAQVPGALTYTARAFVAGIFFPTIALIATIASISYVTRLYGAEIDLSRITQLV